jgi:hypothetical protein
MPIAKRDGVVLRLARDEDMAKVDEITITCYGPIMESYVAMIGEECHQAVRHDPELTWEERKTGQNHNITIFAVSRHCDIVNSIQSGENISRFPGGAICSSDYF